jgi:predicted oxidoreductase
MRVSALQSAETRRPSLPQGGLPGFVVVTDRADAELVLGGRSDEAGAAFRSFGAVLAVDGLEAERLSVPGAVELALAADLQHGSSRDSPGGRVRPPLFW